MLLRPLTLAGLFADTVTLALAAPVGTAVVDWQILPRGSGAGRRKKNLARCYNAVRSLVLLSLILAGVSGCETKKPVPANDTTEPKIYWRFIDESSGHFLNQDVVGADKQITVGPDRDYLLYLIAEDPE